MYFAILTLSLGLLGWFLVKSMRGLTGGDDGIAVYGLPSFFDGTSLYFFILLIVLICFAVLWVIRKSSFGLTIRGIKENPDRVEHVGISVTKYRIALFTISAFFAGIAGVLYFLWGHVAYPDYLSAFKSGDAVYMAILGGTSAFFGPVIGAIVFFFIQYYASVVTIYWHAILGGSLVLMMLFMPTGIWGGTESLYRKYILRRRKTTDEHSRA